MFEVALPALGSIDEVDAALLVACTVTVLVTITTEDCDVILLVV